jgi:hypothetical protein
VVELLPSKCEVLSLNPNTAKEERKGRARVREREVTSKGKDIVGSKFKKSTAGIVPIIPLQLLV